MKHRAKPTELAFDQPLDFRLIQDATTDWEKAEAERKRIDQDKKRNDNRQLEIT